MLEELRTSLLFYSNVITGELAMTRTFGPSIQIRSPKSSCIFYDGEQDTRTCISLDRPPKTVWPGNCSYLHQNFFLIVFFCTVAQVVIFVHGKTKNGN